MIASNSSQSNTNQLNGLQIAFGAIGLFGLFILFAAWAQLLIQPNGMWLGLSLSSIFIGVFGYSYASYASESPGIKNDGIMFSTISHRGLIGWIAGIVITGFYVILYLKPEWMGLQENGNVGLVALFDPLSQMIKGKPASQWFVYGVLYTTAILVFGVKFIWKYRHNWYQVVRTISVMVFQLFFAFLIPEMLEALHPETGEKWFGKDAKNMWPLDYDFFYQWHIDNIFDGGFWGLFFFIFGLAMIFVISPILTYFFGKRWYCSWVCGCGGLAETAGDPFRHLSDKSTKAWKIERWVIHLVLVFTIITTIAAIYGYLGNDPEKYYLTRQNFTILTIGIIGLSAVIYWILQKKNQENRPQIQKWLIIGVMGMVALVLGVNYLFGSNNAYFLNSYQFKAAYGLYVGAIFSGVIGVGFYPIMGSRVWCRFGCPMAAILGMQQKFFSRFRITTNGGQCISCGNCSTYCEMGIDVRAYAQRGENIVRSSCVGCGICSAVCPRGVLRLENGSTDIYSKTGKNKVSIVPEDQVGIL